MENALPPFGPFRTIAQGVKFREPESPPSILAGEGSRYCHAFTYVHMGICMYAQGYGRDQELGICCNPVLCFALICQSYTGGGGGDARAMQH